MNKVVLIGRTTSEISVAQIVKSNISLAKFTLAVNRRYRNESGDVETDFINCIAWGKTADVIGEYVKKGNRIAVAGNIQTRTYDAQDGTKRYVTEVVVDEIEFLESKCKEDTTQATDHRKELEQIDDDGLPF